VTKPKQVKGLYEEKEKELQPGTIIKAARVARQERRAFMTTLRSSTCKKKLSYSSFFIWRVSNFCAQFRQPGLLNLGGDRGVVYSCIPSGCSLYPKLLRRLLKEKKGRIVKEARFVQNYAQADSRSFIFWPNFIMYTGMCN
jgi:hypothetical protein